MSFPQPPQLPPAGPKPANEDPQLYVVQPGDWLSKIALEKGFTDGGAAIWNANPELRTRTNNNPDLLKPGWTLKIPPVKPRRDTVPANQKHRFRVERKPKNLRLTLQEPVDPETRQAGPASGWKWTLIIGDSKWSGTTGADGRIDVQNVPQNERRGQLILTAKAFGIWKFPPEVVLLDLGRIDPLPIQEPQTEEAFQLEARAIQGILRNLGYYSGEVDGVLGPKSRAAIRAFQRDQEMPVDHGLADQPTCERLARASAITMAPPKGIEKKEAGRSFWDEPLVAGPVPIKYRERVTVFSEYQEPTAVQPAQPRPNSNAARETLGQFHFFPHRISVTPSEPGAEGRNPNVVRMPNRRFIFLDAGRWYGEARDFAVVWGRHTYLCKFHPGGGQAAYGNSTHRGRLDHAFFQGMEQTVEIVKTASAWWAPSDDFDWSRLHIIVPDLHLLTPEHSAKWHFVAEWDQKPEKDLLQFAETLTSIAALDQKTRVVQLGDSYDLWVARDECFYVPNEDLTVELVATAPRETILRTIAGWVREIAADNPAHDALRLLEQKTEMVYLHGNHDNYLILPEVAQAAGLRPRHAYCEWNGVLVEHGHRLEFTFLEHKSAVGGLLKSSPTSKYNYDGAKSGFDATVSAWHDARDGKTTKAKFLKWIADQWAGMHDQEQYIGEAAQFWLGRQSRGQLKPPHVYVIGHTHMPNLWEVDIDAYRV